MKKSIDRYKSPKKVRKISSLNRVISKHILSSQRKEKTYFV